MRFVSFSESALLNGQLLIWMVLSRGSSFLYYSIPFLPLNDNPDALWKQFFPKSIDWINGRLDSAIDLAYWNALSQKISD